MSDILDIAAETEERIRTAAIATHRQVNGPSPTGSCLWCDHPVEEGLRWCGTNCRDGWQHYQDRVGSNQLN